MTFFTTLFCYNFLLKINTLFSLFTIFFFSIFKKILMIL